MQEITAKMGLDRIFAVISCTDAPETAQVLWGGLSAVKLKELLPVGQVVTLRVVDRDRYGRTVTEVFKDDSSVAIALHPLPRRSIWIGQLQTGSW